MLTPELLLTLNQGLVARLDQISYQVSDTAPTEVIERLSDGWLEALRAFDALMRQELPRLDLNAPTPPENVPFSPTPPLWLSLVKPWSEWRYKSNHQPHREAIEARIRDEWRATQPTLDLPSSVIDWPLAWLVRAGADVTAHGPWRFVAQSALDWAARCASVEALALLLDSPQQVPREQWLTFPVAPGKHNMIPNHLLGSALYSLEHTRALLERGVPADLEDAAGRRALPAVEKPLVLEALIEAGADPCALDVQGQAWHARLLSGSYLLAMPRALWQGLHGRNDRGMPVAPQALAYADRVLLHTVLGEREHAEALAHEPVAGLWARAQQDPAAWTLTHNSVRAWGLLGQNVRKCLGSLPPLQTLNELLRADVAPAVWTHESIEGVSDGLLAQWVGAKLMSSSSSMQRPNKELNQRISRVVRQLYPNNEAWAEAMVSGLARFTQRHALTDDAGVARDPVLGDLHPTWATMSLSLPHPGGSQQTVLTAAPKQGAWWYALPSESLQLWVACLANELVERSANNHSGLPLMVETLMNQRLDRAQANGTVREEQQLWWPLVTAGAYKESEKATKNPLIARPLTQRLGDWITQGMVFTPDSLMPSLQECLPQWPEGQSLLHAYALAQDLSTIEADAILDAPRARRPRF